MNSEMPSLVTVDKYHEDDQIFVFVSTYCINPSGYELIHGESRMSAAHKIARLIRQETIPIRHYQDGPVRTTFDIVKEID